MNYGGVNFLGVISWHEHVGTIKKAKINKVSQVKLLPFTVSKEKTVWNCRLQHSLIEIS